MAGVPRIVLVVPPVPGGRGEVDPAVLVVCRKLGIDDVFRVNGPAGIAALGFGTETIPRGAQGRRTRLAGGHDRPGRDAAPRRHDDDAARPDRERGRRRRARADPVRLAADLLIEAEHGTDSSVVLLTTRRRAGRRRPTPSSSVQLGRSARAVAAEAARAALGVERRLRARQADLDEAIDDRQPLRPRAPAGGRGAAERRRGVVDALVNAGEILIGQHTPFSAANFVIGCPASLPTSGFAHVRPASPPTRS